MSRAETTLQKPSVISEQNWEFLCGDDNIMSWLRERVPVVISQDDSEECQESERWNVYNKTLGVDGWIMSFSSRTEAITFARELELPITEVILAVAGLCDSCYWWEGKGRMDNDRRLLYACNSPNLDTNTVRMTAADSGCIHFSKDGKDNQ